MLMIDDCTLVEYTVNVKRKERRLIDLDPPPNITNNVKFFNDTHRTRVMLHSDEYDDIIRYHIYAEHSATDASIASYLFQVKHAKQKTPISA